METRVQIPVGLQKNISNKFGLFRFFCYICIVKFIDIKNKNNKMGYTQGSHKVVCEVKGTHIVKEIYPVPLIGGMLRQGSTSSPTAVTTEVCCVLFIILRIQGGCFYSILS